MPDRSGDDGIKPTPPELTEEIGIKCNCSIKVVATAVGRLVPMASEYMWLEDIAEFAANDVYYISLGVLAFPAEAFDPVLIFE